MKQILSLGYYFFISFISSGQAGIPDTDFGNNGQTLIVTNHNRPGEINDIAQQADGKILIAGEEYFSTQANNAVIVRYKTDGIVDSSFGVNGFADAFTSSRYTSNNAQFIKVLSDGKILVLINAEGNFSDHPDIILVRYNPDGSRDNNFGQNGMLIKNIDIDYASAMAVQADGKILFGGQVNSIAFIARCNANGSDDASFGNGGIVYAGPNTHSAITAIALTSNQQILVAGSGAVTTGKTYDGAFIAKYNVNGKKDGSFGMDGVVITQAPLYLKSVVGLSVLPGDNFLVSYFLFHNSQYYPVAVLSKYKADGSPDASFGKAGRVTSGYPGNFLSYRTSEIALQQDGKIVLAGQFISNDAKYAIAVTRLLPNGQNDASFGENGTVFTHQYYSKTNALLIQQDGKIVVGGSVQTGANKKIKLSLTRYLSDNTAFIATKTEEKAITSAVKLFPNPVKDVLYITGLNSSAKTVLTVVNARGNTIQTIAVQEAIYNFNVSRLTKGTYYLQVKTGETIKTYQFLKE